MMHQQLGVLHSLDHCALGLSDYGREGNYYRRQHKTWSAAWDQSKADPTPQMDELIRWLGDTMQPQVRTTIVHGDFRLENLMFHPTAPRGERERECASALHCFAHAVQLWLSWIGKSARLAIRAPTWRANSW